MPGKHLWELTQDQTQTHTWYTNCMEVLSAMYADLLKINMVHGCLPGTLWYVPTGSHTIHHEELLPPGHANVHVTMNGC